VLEAGPRTTHLKVAKTDRPKQELEGKLPPLNPSLFGFLAAKKATVVARNGDNNYCRLFRWFCCEEGDNNNVVIFFYGGCVVKKALTISNFFLSFFLFRFFLSFWFSSLKLTINNEMVVFFNVEGNG